MPASWPRRSAIGAPDGSNPIDANRSATNQPAPATRHPTPVAISASQTCAVRRLRQPDAHCRPERRPRDALARARRRGGRSAQRTIGNANRRSLPNASNRQSCQRAPTARDGRRPYRPTPAGIAAHRTPALDLTPGQRRPWSCANAMRARASNRTSAAKPITPTPEHRNIASATPAAIVRRRRTNLDTPSTPARRRQRRRHHQTPPIRSCMHISSQPCSANIAASSVRAPSSYRHHPAFRHRRSVCLIGNRSTVCLYRCLSDRTVPSVESCQQIIASQLNIQTSGRHRHRLSSIFISPIIRHQRPTPARPGRALSPARASPAYLTLANRPSSSSSAAIYAHHRCDATAQRPIAPPVAPLS